MDSATCQEQECFQQVVCCTTQFKNDHFNSPELKISSCINVLQSHICSHLERGTAESEVKVS